MLKIQELPEAVPLVPTWFLLLDPAACVGATLEGLISPPPHRHPLSIRLLNLKWNESELTGLLYKNLLPSHNQSRYFPHHFSQFSVPSTCSFEQNGDGLDMGLGLK